MADEVVAATEAPAADTKAEKTLKGYFKAKEDCYLVSPYGYKKADDPVFYYEGPQHDSLVKAKAPKPDDE